MATQDNTPSSPILAAQMQKKRSIVSYANMSEELAAAFKEKYPHGYSDYCGDIVKIDKPNGTSFYAITVELPTAVYMVKIDVNIDDYDDVEKVLDEDVTNSEDSGDVSFPEDDDKQAAAMAAEDAAEEDEN